MNKSLTILILVTVLFFSALALAHDKVVVIPLQGNTSNKFYSPVPVDSPPGLAYTDNANGTVTDNVTGLIWQKSDDNLLRSWIDARNYCQFITDASVSDWRVPSIDELMSIVDYGANGPSINTIFTGTNSSKYWSETVSANIGNFIWVIEFNTGELSTASESITYYVRCVR